MSEINGTIVGYDPGGNDNHGLALLKIEKGMAVDIEVATASNTEAVLNRIFDIRDLIGLGVDTLTCWNTGRSGWRPADIWLRKNYPDVQNQVASPNSLFGSMGINGMAVLIEVSNAFDDIILTETHPKVLYYGLQDNRYNYSNDSENMNAFLAEILGINSIITRNEHEWDAAISAYALLMGVTGIWQQDLHQLPLIWNDRIVKPCGDTHYFWPNI